jgi:hypothetical protein
MVSIRIKISKKQWIRLSVFAGLITVAAVFDIYFENSNVQVTSVEKSANHDNNEKGSGQLFTQTIDFGGKIQVLKVTQRKWQPKSHDKLLQQFHKSRNYQVLKAEVQTQTAPLINSYHYLAFKNYFYSVPDDIPLNS